MTLGERIKELRIEKRLTQLELANMLFVTDRAVSKWEQGRGNPDINVLPVLASSLGVSVDFLLTGEERAPQLNDKQEMLISYFESVIGQVLTSEFLKRAIIKHLDKYSVEQIKDALDICYDSYLSKSERPFQPKEIESAISKLRGILYNNDLPPLEREINKLMYYLGKNSPNPIYYKKECERSLRNLLELYIGKNNDTSVALDVINKIYTVCVQNKNNYRSSVVLFSEIKKELNKRSVWKEIDTHDERPDAAPFAAIGNGQIKLSIGACKLLNNFNYYHYVSFTRAKKDRVYFVGLRFEQNKGDNSFSLCKESGDEYGATVYAPDLLKTLYGNESISSVVTKHDVVVDKNNPNTLVVYYKYKKKYYINDDENNKKQMRSKHIGTIVDKEWKVVSSSGKAKNGKKYPTYTLINIRTNEEVEVSTRGLADIERGVSSVDNIKMSRIIGLNSYKGKKRAEKKERIKVLSVDNNINNNERLPNERTTSNLSSADELEKIKETHLFKELKKYRQEKAKKLGVAPFVVASDRTLLNITVSKPSNNNELLLCHGFGVKKCEQYGADILEIVSKYKDK